MPSRNMLAYGRVQGVGFRANVSRCAQQLGLSGWVRNKADGSVQIKATGAVEKLDLFETMVRNACGGFARVDSLEVTPAADVPETGKFEIR